MPRHDLQPNLHRHRHKPLTPRKQREEVVKLFADTVAAYGKVDIVVNNAGRLAAAMVLAGLTLSHPQASPETLC